MRRTVQIKGIAVGTVIVSCMTYVTICVDIISLGKNILDKSFLKRLYSATLLRKMAYWIMNFMLMTVTQAAISTVLRFRG